jgi:hypothetical protein
MGQNLLVLLVSVWALDRLVTHGNYATKALGLAGVAGLVFVYTVGLHNLFETRRPMLTLRGADTFVDTLNKRAASLNFEYPPMLFIPVYPPFWGSMAIPESYVQATVSPAFKYDGKLIAQPPAGRGRADGIYAVRGGRRRWIMSMDWLARNGYKADEIQLISPTEFDRIPEDPEPLI